MNCYEPRLGRRSVIVGAVLALALGVLPAGAAADSYSGTVTMAGSGPAANVEVEILAEASNGNVYDINQALTQPDGTYSVIGNPNTTNGDQPDVWVRFAIGSPEQQYYNNAFTFSSAEAIPWTRACSRPTPALTPSCRCPRVPTRPRRRSPVPRSR